MLACQGLKNQSIKASALVIFEADQDTYIRHGHVREGCGQEGREFMPPAVKIGLVIGSE